MIKLSTNQKTNKALHDFEKPGAECGTKCDWVSWPSPKYTSYEDRLILFLMIYLSYDVISIITILLHILLLNIMILWYYVIKY